MAENEIFNRRWIMFDFARQRVFVRSEFTLWMDALQRLGYNGIGIYFEGAFDFPGIPGVVREGVMTPDDAKWAVEEGKKRGLYVFPMTNVVGHMESFFDQERNRELMADISDMQIDFLKDGAEEFVMNFVHEYVRAFDAKMIHIGGDETTLTPETKIAYAQFLAKICKNLLDEGIQPAIWDDMIWMDLPLCDYFDRRTMIFDWSYYGHRPESPKYFRDIGFRDVVVCPCDNSWEGIINYQRASGYLKASLDPVRPDEIEALLDDAKKAGVMDGILTNWDNEAGRNMWPQWVPIARSGLFMNGKFPAGGHDEEKIETALFGRITPYTRVTYLLQEKIQRKDIEFTWFENMRNGLFIPENLYDLIDKARKELPSFPEEYDQALDEIDGLLLDWTPENEFEEKCRTAMVGNAAMVRAANEIIKAGCAYRFYARAAELQFKADDSAAQLIAETSGAFRRAAAEVTTFASVFARAINGTGHAKFDIDRIRNTARFLEGIADRFDTYIPTVSRIPIPRFEKIVDSVIRGTYIM